ncbi:MAG: nucleotidyltransferase family protein [FCB group bacterium]|nr:nucleotidyltransferase family protein [FCB group bacterium]
MPEKNERKRSFGRPKMTALPVIITAAGRSTRHPPNKLLLKRDGVPLIVHTVAAFVGLSDPLIVVTGHDSGALTKTLEEHYPGVATLVFNADYREGLSTSLRAGLKALKTVVSPVGFCNGDRPFIRRETVRDVLQAAVRHPDKISFPCFQEQPGQPIFFPHDLLYELEALSGEEGGRIVRDRYRKRCWPIAVHDRGVMLDLDRYFMEHR